MSNFNTTGEVKEISILDIMNGAVGERVSYELERVIKNCVDPNTDAKKARTLTVQFTFTPTEARDSAGIKVSVKSKLEPVKSIDSTLLIGGDYENPVIMEYTPQISGQRNLSGLEQEEPRVIRMAKAN